MKIKLDENLPLSLAKPLKTLGHDVHTVKDEDLLGRSDGEIWRSTQKEARLLVTQDLDFSDLRKFAPGSHSGIVLVRLHSPSRLALIDRIVDLFRRYGPEDWVGCFVVATERKIRVLRPESS